MAASMDGEPVSVGDAVYDMVWGPGVVSQVQLSGNFVVRFSGTRSATYMQSGVNTRYAGRTLFWRDPIIVVPMKNEARWVLVRQLVNGIVAPVRGWGCN